jgi:hypothetical protein
MLIFLTILSREEAFSSFKKSIEDGGKNKRDFFGVSMEGKTVYMEDLLSTSSTRYVSYFFISFTL